MKTFIQKVVFSLFSLVLVMGFIPLFQPQKAKAAVNPNYLILDSIFENTTSMTPQQLDGVINRFYPSSCISTLGGFGTPDPLGFSGSSYQFGSPVSAGQAIYDIAQNYHINPQVILTTMQKEQSMVTGSTGCHPNTPDKNNTFTCTIGSKTGPCTTACTFSGGCMAISMSYDCPGNCWAAIEDDSSTGISNQISGGTWLLRFAEERSYGILTGYAGFDSGDDAYCYSGPMTAGYRQRSSTTNSCNGAPGNQSIYYDGTWTDNNGQSVTISNGATASLYTYTPFVSDTHFSTIWTSTFNFGPMTSPCYSDTNLSATSGEHVIPTKLGINHTDNLTITQPNNTGTGCVEAYTWLNGNYNSWMRLLASASPTFDPSSSGIISADLNGDGIDELYKVDYSGTGSGKLEVHGFTSTLQSWASHVATNSPTWSHADAEVIACDPAGYGHDNLFLVEYHGTTSGDVEIHEWAPGLQQWVNHWDTHYRAIDPSNAQIVCGDLNGDGKDEFYLVQYNSTGSGRLEVHGGITNLGYNSVWPYSSPAQWPVHTATISGYRTHWESAWAQGSTSGAPANDADLIMADTVGNGVDRPYIVQYHGTASGRVEIYQMTNDFKNWVMLTTTNQGSY